MLRAQPEPQTTLAGQVEITRLVDLAAQRLNIAVDYDAAAIKAAGTVSLRAGDDLSDHELWLLVNRVLAARGLTTVRASGSNAYSVVKIADAPGLSRTDASPQAGPPAGFRTVVVRARHRSAKDLIEAVNKTVGKPSGGTGGGTAALRFADHFVDGFHQVLGGSVFGPHHHGPKSSGESVLIQGLGAR